VCAKDGQNWHCACFGSSANGARKQSLTAESEKLLGFAEAAAGSRSKSNGANWHAFSVLNRGYRNDHA
jgi:hypothetical protein